jgi:hypothetical protein
LLLCLGHLVTGEYLSPAPAMHACKDLFLHTGASSTELDSPVAL